MRLGKIELLVWKDIKDYDDSAGWSVLLRCPVNGIYVGWLDDIGWRNVATPDHIAEAMIPQPVYYMEN